MKMNAYMLKSDKKVEPFDDHPRDCLIANHKLGDIQKEVLQALGLEFRESSDLSQVEDPDEHIIFDDSLFFSKEVMQEFINKSRTLNRGTVCAVKPGLSTLRTVVPTQDVQVYEDRVEYGLYYVPVETFRGNTTIPVVLDVDRSYQSIPMPEHMFGETEYRVPITDRLIAQIDHWPNLWAANIAYLLAKLARLETASKTKLLGLALKACSLNQWKVLCQTNKIGRNCDIHPTAYIEGSTIGDNVTIGARATVREATIGDNTCLGDNVTVHLSVLGENCNIQAGSIVEYYVLYPGVLNNQRFLGIGMCGRDSFIGGPVVLTNFRVDGRNMIVVKNGTMIDTGNTYLGSCLGHNVYLGAGCIVAPGRAIPNGTRLAPESSQVIRKCLPGEDVPGYRRVGVGFGA
jgi:acetyltransferase-like isoleucine patch superfamily enzyme